MKLESFDLNLLLVFDALARLRTLFGDPLFEKTGGRMLPTPRARQLLLPISEAISALREALDTQRAFRPQASSREFLLATNDYIESLLLAPIAQRLQRDAPSVAVRSMRTDYLFLPPLDHLQTGELDLALGFFGDTPQPQHGLLTERLCRGRLVCILRQAHPRANRKLTLQAFAGIPHVRILYPPNERLGSIDTILRGRGLSRRIAITVPHYLTIPSTVAKSDLLGVVPERLARREARRLRLKIFEPPVGLPDISVVMAWHERLQFDRAHSWFRDCVAAASASLR